MEYDNQDEKVGPWILTICILYFIGSVFNILLSILSFTMKDLLVELNIPLSPTTLGISIVMSIVIFIGAVLILKKSKLGIALFYVGILGSLVNSVVASGFKSSLVGGLMLPILMAIFLNSKKELFGFGNK